LNVRSRRPLYFTGDSYPALHQPRYEDRSKSNVEEERSAATSRLKTRTPQREVIPEGLVLSWSKRLDIRGSQPSEQADDSSRTGNWSEVQETTASDGGAPLHAAGRGADKVVGDERRQLTASPPQTVCHVRVTVRHRSPRPGPGGLGGVTGSVQRDAGADAMPVPALRRAGDASKRTPPSSRHVTFSELPPPVVDERGPMFAAPRRQHDAAATTQPALDTLWHYHEIYPSMDQALAAPHGNTLDVIYPSVDSHPNGPTLADSLDLRRPDQQVTSLGDRSQETTTRNDNDNENTKRPDDDVRAPCAAERTTPEQSSLLANQRDPSSRSADDDDGNNDDDDDKEDEEGKHQHQQQQQQQHQGSGTDNAVGDLEEVSLSLRQLVASFESMTSPYMRPPVIAASRTQ